MPSRKSTYPSAVSGGAPASSASCTSSRFAASTSIFRVGGSFHATPTPLLVIDPAALTWFLRTITPSVRHSDCFSRRRSSSADFARKRSPASFCVHHAGASWCLQLLRERPRQCRNPAHPTHLKLRATRSPFNMERAFPDTRSSAGRRDLDLGPRFHHRCSQTTRHQPYGKPARDLQAGRNAVMARMISPQALRELAMHISVVQSPAPSLPRAHGRRQTPIKSNGHGSRRHPKTTRPHCYANKKGAGRFRRWCLNSR